MSSPVLLEAEVLSDGRSCIACPEVINTALAIEGDLEWHREVMARLGATAVSIAIMERDAALYAGPLVTLIKMCVVCAASVPDLPTLAMLREGDVDVPVLWQPVEVSA